MWKALLFFPLVLALLLVLMSGQRELSRHGGHALHAGGGRGGFSFSDIEAGLMPIQRALRGVVRGDGGAAASSTQLRLPSAETTGNNEERLVIEPVSAEEEIK